MNNPYWQRRRDMDSSECHVCGRYANWKCLKCKEWICMEHTKGLFVERKCPKCYEEEECVNKETK